MSPDLNKEQPSKPKSVRFGFIWLLNSLFTFLALFLFFTTDMGTREFLDMEVLLCLAMIAFFAFVPIVVIETVVFLLTKRILVKKELSSSIARRWLCGPSWLFALILTAYALWNITPQKRLAHVCGETSITAQHIRVAGCTGIAMGEWLAVFETTPNEFQKLVDSQKMQTNSPENFSETLSHAALIKYSMLFNQLPTKFASPSFKREVIGVDGNLHGGIYATFNPINSCAIVFSTGY